MPGINGRILIEETADWPDIVRALHTESLNAVSIRTGVARQTLRDGLRRTGTVIVRTGPGGGPPPRMNSHDEKLRSFEHLYGQLPDRELAEMAGVHINTIARARRALEIPSFRETGPGPPRLEDRRDWPEITRALRTTSTLRVAAQFKTTTRTLREAIARTGVEIVREFRPGSRDEQLASVRHLIGVESDTEVARRLGVAIPTVQRYREEHGIPAATAWRHRRKPQPPVKPSTRPDGPRAPIDWDRWSHLLGTRPDAEIAAVVGCTVATISVARRKRRIPHFGYQPPGGPTAAAAEVPPPLPRKVSPVDAKLVALHHLLGVYPDVYIANRVGCAPWTVSRYRTRLGIAPYRWGKGKAGMIERDRGKREDEGED